MEKTEKIRFKSGSFGERLGSMLSVDFRRMFTMPLFYIMTGICFVIPILILVMTTMMDGTVTVDPNTGVETTIEAFQNVWQVVGTVSGAGAGMDMSLTGMCNINLLYFLTAVFVCIFVAEEFRSGYAKHLFTVRAKKNDYIASKTLVCFAAGACVFLAFFAGTMLGGAIAGLPFDTGTAGSSGIVMCLLSKILLIAVFVPLYLLMSVVGKQKLWLSILTSLCISMLFYTMIPMMTPLDAGIMNVVLCLAGGVLFSVGIGAGSSLVLRKTSLV